MRTALFSLSTECSIIEFPRSVYYEKRSSNGDEDKKKEKQEKEAEHCKRCDTVLSEWTECDTYGHIKMSKRGFFMGCRVYYKTNLYCLGLHGVSPRFITTRVAKGKQGKYPYLLRNRVIRYVNEV